MSASDSWCVGVSTTGWASAGDLTVTRTPDSLWLTMSANGEKIHLAIETADVVPVVTAMLHRLNGPVGGAG